MKIPPAPDDAHVKAVCKIGQGEACCRYLCLGAAGWSCEKLTSLGRLLDAKVAANTIGSHGDNCLGMGAR